MATEPTDSELFTAAEMELIDCCKDDLYAFIRLTWPVLHDGKPIIDTWHVPLMCRYLEAIAGGRIHRLVICIPPGFAKSLTVSVFYSAWRWLREPSRQITAFSTSNDVAVRDARRTRQILRSSKYQQICQRVLGKPLNTVSDEDTKKSFELTTGGSREGHPIGGRNIGRRSDEQIIDDPHDPNDAIQRPEVARRRIDRTVERVDGTLPDRLNNQNTGPRIVIQQRIYPGDTAGVYIERGWPNLVLPMEYDPDHPHISPDDPRTEKGELLCPELMGAQAVDRQKGKPLAQAKLQQLPKAGGETLYDETMILATDRTDEELRCAPRYVLSIDPTGGGDGDNDPAAMVVFADWPDRSVVVDASQESDDWEPMVEEFDRLCERWPVTHALIEKTVLGPALASHAKNKGLVVEEFKPSAHGGKYARAKIGRQFWRSGQVRVSNKKGAIGEMVDQMIDFPNVGHDDLVDAGSQFCIWRFNGDNAPTSEEFHFTI